MVLTLVVVYLLAIELVLFAYLHMLQFMTDFGQQQSAIAYQINVVVAIDLFDHQPVYSIFT